MPNIQVKLRRGTTAQHGSFTGAEGEVTVDTDKDTVVVHDGSTAGGHELRKKSDTIAGSEIDNDAVDTAQIAANAVTSTEIAANAVTSTEIAANAVTSTEIAANAVTSAKISDTDTQFLVDDTSAQKTVVVNEGGTDVDFRVEGDTDQNLLFCEGSSDKVLIGDTSADENGKFSVVGNSSAVVQSLENKSTTGLAALVIRAATAILQLKDDQASVDSGTFNIQSAGDKLEIESISDDGLTATTLLDIDTSGNMRIAGTLTQNHTF